MDNSKTAEASDKDKLTNVTKSVTNKKLTSNKTAEAEDKNSWFPEHWRWYNTLTLAVVISMWISDGPFLESGAKYSVLNVMKQIWGKFCSGNENVKTAKFVSWLKSMGSLKSMDRRETRWHNSERNFCFSGKTIVMVNCLNCSLKFVIQYFMQQRLKELGKIFKARPLLIFFCFLIGTWPICASFVVSHFMWLDWSSFLTIFLLGLKPLSMFTLMNMFDKFWEILLPQLHSRSQTFRQKKKTQKIILDKFKKTNLIDIVYFH